MINNVDVLCSSSNNFVVKRDKKRETEKDAPVFKGQDILTLPAQEENEVADMLYRLEREEQNPAFTLSFADSENSKKQFEEFYLASKKNMLKMLVRSAQMRLPQQYTNVSWKTLVRQMREAMSISGRANANSASLNKALNLMRRGLSGLRYNMVKPEYKNLKRPLPMEKLHQKNKSFRPDDMANQSRLLNGASFVSSVSTKVKQNAIGNNVDISCFAKSGADTAVAVDKLVDLQV